MKIGDRVSLGGRSGRIEGFAPGPMADVRFDDSPRWTERHKPSDLTPMGARRNPELSPDEEKRKAAAEAKARSEVARVGNLRSAKDKRSRKINIEEELKRTGVGVFTRPDPPRLSDDGSGYCGNPLDETAYYLVLDAARPPALSWAKWEEVEEHASDAGVDLGPDLQILVEVPEAGDLREIALRAVLNETGVEGTRGDPLLAIMLDRLQILFTDGSEPLQGLPASGAFPVPRGSILVVTGPSLEKVYKLNTYFLENYLIAMQDEPGMEIFAVDVPELQKIRGRSGKRKAKGLPSDLLPEGKKGGSRIPGQFPEPYLNVAALVPGQGVRYFRQKESVPANLRKLQRFQPFARRKIRTPPKQLLPAQAFQRQKYSPFAVAIHEVTRREGVYGPKGISLDLAQTLIVSGCVRVRFRDVLNPLDPPEEQRVGMKSVLLSGLWDENRNAWADPYIENSFIQIYWAMHDVSPFFSWVRTEAPIQEIRQNIPSPCLTEEDHKVLRVLDYTNQSLSQFKEGLSTLRRMFRQIALNPGKVSFDREDPTGGFLDRKTGQRFKRSQYMSTPRKGLSAVIRANTGLIQWFSKLSEALQHPEEDLVLARAANAIHTVDRSLLDPEGPVLEAAQTARDLRLSLAGPKPRTSEELKRYEQSLRGGMSDEMYERFIVHVSNYLNDEYKPPRPILQKPSPGLVEGPAALTFFQGIPRDRLFQGAYLPHPMTDVADSILDLLPADAAIDIGRSLVKSGPAVNTWRHGETMWFSEHPENDWGVEETLGPREATLRRIRLAKQAKDDTLKLSEYIESWAQGGTKVRTGREAEDYEYYAPGTTAPFTLGSVPKDDHNRNWVTSLLVNSVYPAVVKSLGGDTADNRETAGQLCAELIIAAEIYIRLGGVQLLGPLIPETKDPEKGLPALIQAITDAKTKMKGGSTRLTARGRFTVYKTYNPILFELTRLFWPLREGGGAVWGTILSHSDLFQDTFEVGRYNYLLATTQQAVFKSSNEEQLSKRLLEGVLPAQGQRMRDILSSRRRAAANRFGKQVPYGTYRPFLLALPLGLVYYPSTKKFISPAQKDIYNWVEAPADYLYQMKSDVEVAIGRILDVRYFGVKPLPISDDPLIREVINQKRPPLDPLTPPTTPEEIRAMGRLQDALQKSVEKDLGLYMGRDRPEENQRLEKVTLERFQRSPGNVRVRGPAGRPVPEELLPVPKTGVYDSATIQLLERAARKSNRPQSEVPFVLSEREEAKRQGIYVEQGQTDIYEQSVLRRAEEEARQDELLLQEVNRTLRALETKLRAKRGSP